MIGKNITVDFSKKCGKIKPLGGMNGAPRSGGVGLPFDFTEEFITMGTPVVRVGAGKGDYGYNQYLNIHSIFPDFSADETLEESYNFLPTDLYLASVKNTGAEIIYCLGEASEPYTKKLYAKSPADLSKFARICEHIIMHYNEMWANGFKWNLKYFEIWSSADTAEGFFGAPEEYFELYRVVANHLRDRFPKIRLGAYGARGFYALNRIDATEEMKGYVPFMQQFLAYIGRESTYAPLDFFTWSCYTSNPEEMAMHMKYARTYLDGAGQRRTRSILCEHNTALRSGAVCLSSEFPSALASELIMGQKSPVDMMIYATTDVTSPKNGLFSVEDYSTHRHYSAYHVMCAFSELYRLGGAVETTADFRKEVYSLAAQNSDGAAVLVVTRKYEGKIELTLKESQYTHCSVRKIKPEGERGQAKIYNADNVPIAGSKIVISAKEGEIYLIKLFGEN